MKCVAHLTIALGCYAITLSPRLFWPGYYATTVTDAADKATKRRAIEIEADWKGFPFTSVLQDGFDDAFFTKIDWLSLSLSEPQAAKLKPRVLELIHYFQQPDFDTYFRLKTAGLHYEFVPQRWTTNFLQNTRKLQKEDDIIKEQVKLLWDKVHTRGGKTVMPRLTAISIETVSGAISHTNSGRAMLGGPIKKGFTIAGEALEPGFLYTPNQAKDALPLLFEFSFLAKANDSGIAGPLYISLVWVEADEQWALNRMILDTWHGLHTMF
jgi:hypothetical protein